MTHRQRRPLAASAPHRAASPLAALAIAVCLLLVPAAAQAGAVGAASIPDEQLVVTLLSVKSVHAEPVFDSSSVAAVADQRPITLVRTTLPVLAQQTDGEGRLWLQVRLPGRVLHRKSPPRSGWITAFDTRISTTAWHLVVDVGARRVTAYRGAKRQRSFRVIVGKSATPTPRGEYFVEETMRLPARHVGAPFAIAASARSAVLKEFMGGPGQIALHGVTNIGGKMGSAVSNGCIRMTSGALAWLAPRIKAGVPLTIR